ncbi:MAG TPA: hypothetical protein DEX20_01320 [Halieaceae bacterium]|nr:hypothetical protein [Halieaceae bacterium]
MKQGTAAKGLCIQIFGFVCNLFITIELARQLELSAFGQVSILIALSTIGVLCFTAPLVDLTVRTVGAVHSGQASPSIYSEMSAHSNALTLLIAIALSLICIGLACMIDVFSFIDMMLTAITTVCISLTTLVGAAFRGENRILLGQLIQTAAFPFVFLLSLLSLSSAADPSDYHRIVELRALAATGICLLVLGIKLRLTELEILFFSRPRFKRPLLRTSLQLFQIGLIGLLIRQMGLFTVAIFAGLEASGQFRLILLAIMVIDQLAAGVNATYQKAFATVGIDEPLEVLRLSVVKIYRTLLCLGLTASLSFFFVGEFLIKSIFGPEFLLCFYPILFTLIVYSISFIFGPSSIYLIMKEEERAVKKIMFVSLVINLCVTFAVSLRDPLWGGSIGFLCAIITIQFLSMRRCSEYFHFDFLIVRDGRLVGRGR